MGRGGERRGCGVWATRSTMPKLLSIAVACVGMREGVRAPNYVLCIAAGTSLRSVCRPLRSKQRSQPRRSQRCRT